MSIIKDWKQEFCTIPNLLSLFRIILVPVYVTIYLNATDVRDYYLAGGILAVSCLTDMVDGMIARHFNMISTVGKVLDPMADKVTQLALTICLSIRYPVLLYVLILFLAKEIFQVIAALINLRRGKMLPGALMAGKLCTTVLFVSLILLVLFPGISPAVVNAITLTDCAALLIAFISYILAFFGKYAKVEDVPE
jgi:cardiolipin synthase